MCETKTLSKKDLITKQQHGKEPKYLSLKLLLSKISGVSKINLK
jgi:hypothetical protein